MGDARWVYAIVGRDAALPARGDAVGDAVGDAALATVPWRALAAVTRRMDDGPAPLTMDDVLRHEAVVEAVRERGPALPVRFGSVFPDAAAVAAALAQRYVPLVADLDRLGDKVELGLTALRAAPPDDDVTASASWDDGEPAGRGAGARYLRARVAHARREDVVRHHARAIAAEIEAAVGALVLERRVALVPTARIAVRATYLLHPARVEAFRAAFDALRRARGELRFLLTGPWPPYSFVRRTDARYEAAEGGHLDALVRLLTDEVQGRRG